MRYSSRWMFLLLAAAMALALPGAVYTARASEGAAPPGAVAAQDGPLYHTVAAGETLSAIAVRYGTTVAEITRLNNLANPNLIYVGQRLLIREGSGGPPGPTPTPAPPPPNPTPPPPPPSGQTTHVVQSGETLSTIAQRYGVTWQAIAQANNLANPNVIYVGQRLLIPVAGGPPPPPPPPPPRAGAPPLWDGASRRTC